MDPYRQSWQQDGGEQASSPSIFGALPSLPVSPPKSIQADSVTYQFTNFNATILNCTVLGPQYRVQYRVVTESSSAPSCTIFKDNESRSVAMVQWQPNAMLEVRGVASRQRVKDWLRLSSDQR